MAAKIRTPAVSDHFGAIINCKCSRTLRGARTVASLAKSTRVTLHFLEPNVEVHLADELLEPAALRAAIDEAMLRIISSADPLTSQSNRAALPHVQLSPCVHRG